MKLSHTGFQLHRDHSRCGATLLELLVASGIGMAVLLAMTSLTYYAARSFAAMGNYAHLDRASRAALDQMTRDIRTSIYLVRSATNQLVFNTSCTTSRTFTWDPWSRTVTRSATG